jgi:hypothetical protein
LYPLKGYNYDIEKTANSLSSAKNDALSWFYVHKPRVFIPYKELSDLANSAREGGRIGTILPYEGANNAEGGVSVFDRKLTGSGQNIQVRFASCSWCLSCRSIFPQKAF